MMKIYGFGKFSISIPIQILTLFDLVLGISFKYWIFQCLTFFQAGVEGECESVYNVNPYTVEAKLLTNDVYQGNDTMNMLAKL